MILPTFRPMHRDELLYGWIAELAHINYGDDPRGIQRVAQTIFPYGYAPERRFHPSKEELRKDFVRGIGESLQECYKKGYKVPEAWELLTYNTPLYSMGVSRSSSTQARYLYTAMASVYGDSLDMPTLPSSVKTIKICPMCMAKSQYVRTWHHLPGVKACAIHRVMLFDFDSKKELKEDVSVLQEDHPDVVYAAYCKEIYDHPSTASLATVKKIMMPKCNVDEKAVLSRKSTKFQTVIEMLLRHRTSYTTIAKMADLDQGTNNVDRYEILRECRGLAEVLCTKCGNKFTGSLTAIKLGFGCPECMRSVHPNYYVATLLKSTGDGAYRLSGPFQGMGAVQDVVHDTCGKRVRARMVSRLWDKQTCRCETKNHIPDMQREIDKISSGYEVISYVPNEGTAIIRHNNCGLSRNCNWLSFKSSPVCPYCKDKENRKRGIQRLALELGKDYAIQEDLTSKGNDGLTFAVIHKPCGTLIKGTLKQFQGTSQKGPRRCPICTSYFIKEKNTGITPEGKLYIDMKEWFKTHKTWVSRRHSDYHSKEYYDALIVLAKQGRIHRLSPGIYSERADLSVYDVLKERYLLDDSGNICGKYTGKTAEYLGGKAKEPEVITLESELLTRKSVCHVTVCGRKVDVKGC